MDFDRIIFCTLDSSSDNDVINHNVHSFTIKLCDIGVLFDKLTTVITGCKTLVNFRYLLFTIRNNLFKFMLILFELLNDDVVRRNVKLAIILVDITLCKSVCRFIKQIFVLLNISFKLFLSFRKIV